MNEMTMTYELITPEIAEKIMKNNTGNRSLSMGTVRSYAQDMRHGNWNSRRTCWYAAPSLRLRR